MEDKDKLINDLKTSNDEMAKKMAELQSQMLNFYAMASQTNSNNKRVTITALRPRLNLRTEAIGSQQPNRDYYFDTFGETRLVPIEDAKKILYLDNQFKHAQNFWFIISDKEVLEEFSTLSKSYEKMPTTKEINNILACSVERIKEILTMGNEEFVTLLIWRAKVAFLEGDEGLDLNKVKLLSDSYEQEDVMKYFTT